MVAAMTNTAALLFAALLVILIAGDVLANDATALTFLGRRFLGLIEHLAFWR